MGIIFEAVTTFSAESSTVAWLKAERAWRHCAIASNCPLFKGVTLVFKDVRAAPTASRSSYILWSMKNVLFHLVSTSWISFFFGLPICCWIADSFSVAFVLHLKKVTTLLQWSRMALRSAVWERAFFTTRFKVCVKQGICLIWSRLAHSVMFEAWSVMRHVTLSLIPQDSSKMDFASLMCSAVWVSVNFKTPSTTLHNFSSLI